MKIVISGSRSTPNAIERVKRAIAESGWEIGHISHGASGRVDQAAGFVAYQLDIPFKAFPAQWDNFFLSKVIRKFDYKGREYNAAAGFLRNQDMIDYVGKDGGLIAVWDGKSPGTADAIARAVLADLEIFVYKIGFGGFHSANTEKQKQFARLVIDFGYKQAQKQWKMIFTK